MRSRCSTSWSASIWARPDTSRFARLCYLLAAIGAVVPYAILLPWIGANGWAPARFLAAPFATGPAAIFSADALLSALAFLVFVAAEGRRRRMRRLWLYPLVTLTIGLCCAFPLFLAARERVMEEA